MTREESIIWLKLMKDQYPDQTVATKALDMAISALSEKTETLTHEEAWAEIEASDLISRADAIEAVQDVDTRESVNVNEAVKAINALPSADRPTVIKCKSLLSAEDFKKWADRIKEQNKLDNIIVIPCEAEVADRPSGEWIPVDGKLPKVIGHHVLVTIKWADDDLEVCEMCPTVADRYNIIAFQDLPEPYQGEPIKSELQCGGARMENTK